MNSLKRNFLYSSLLTSVNYIFPLLTYPYVSRVLGVENIGICNFVDSIINYFTLFSMMGISATGIREIAANRANKLATSKVFSSLLVLNFITTIVAIVVLLICMYSIPQLFDYRKLLWIGVVKLLFNLFLIEWLYKGTEQFKFITQRAISIRFVYVALIFIFVHDSDDYIIYYGLTSVTIVLNAFINILYSRKIVTFSLKGIHVRQYVKSYMTLGIYLILTSMYTTFNITFLGFACGDVQVGYYTTSTKIYSIIISIFTAFTGVMLPRMSSLVANGDIKEFRAKISSSVDLLVCFSIPTIILCVIFAGQIVDVIAGSQYGGAVVPMQIVMPLILIIGLEQILVIQSMMPLKRDRAIFVNSIIGAILGVGLNILLVPMLKSAGSAIVWVTCETTILVLSQFEMHKTIKYRLPWKNILVNLFYYFPAAIIMFLISQMKISALLQLIMASMMILVYSILLQLYIVKNPFIIGMLKKLPLIYKRHL